MNVVQLLKTCVLAAFVGTILTGVLFIIRSSDEQQIKAHVKDLSANLRNQEAFAGRQLTKAKHKNIGVKQPIDLVKDVDDAKDNKENENVAKYSKIENVNPKTAPLMPTIVTSTTTSLTTTTSAQERVTVEQKALKDLKESSHPPSIHIFYYPWYGSPKFDDGKYHHWNHEILKPWDDKDKHKYPKGHHQPPRDIGSNFYPRLGPYSSSDPEVVDQHMKWLSSAGIDVLAVSWYPKNKADDEGVPWDSLMPLLLNVTDKYKMKVTFHLEPYKTRTAESVAEDIKYIIQTYDSHPAFYRTIGKKGGKSIKELPLFYIYDSYLIAAEEWAKIASVEGSSTIRGTQWDSILIGLYVNSEDEEKIKKANFDGIYTYFASDGFSEGSTIANWPALSKFCATSNLLFIPSVGPGYEDTRVRPWNSKTTKERNNGEYYKEHFKMAHIAKADIVSITSFNEWHEGTQIEPAKPFQDTNGTDFVYSNYEKGPEQYLEITLEMIKTYFTPHHENIPMQIARIV